MKKIIWIIAILMLMLPAYGEEIQLDLDYDVYELGQTIMIQGENIPAESVQIKVTDSTGAGLYNIDQIPVYDGSLYYNFFMPEEAGVGHYKIQTSLGITLTFEVKKHVERDVPEVSMSPDAFSIVADRTVAIRGFVYDENDISFTVDGNYLALTPVENGYSFESSKTYETDGKKGIEIVATDIMKNRTAFTRWFYIDASAPTISLFINDELVDPDKAFSVENEVTQLDVHVVVQDNFPSLTVKEDDSVIYFKENDFVSYADEIQPIEYAFDKSLELGSGKNYYTLQVKDAAGTWVTHTYVFEKSGESKPIEANRPEPGVTLNLNTYNVELEVGIEADVTTYLLKATSNVGGTVVWSSSDPSVATVDTKGQITAHAPGKVTITAKVNGVSKSAHVEVFLIGEELTPQGAVSFNLPYISGYPDGTFRPNNTITRAELAVIYTKILGLTEMSQQAFDDVKDSHWAYDYVNKVAAAGIFSGYSDHTFRPDQAITRAELATTISKYWSLKGIEISEEKLLVSDVSNHWAKNFIYKLYHGKVVNSDMTSFDPDGPALRGQVVEMINNLLGRKPLDVETSKFKDLKDASLIKIIEAATTIILNN